jgi:mRNA interferase MazF
MQEGDIALLNMIQPDGSTKHRPVLLLKKVPPFQDWIVCAVSSQLHQEVKGFDHPILQTDPDFRATGLRQSSLVRLGMLSTVAKSTLPGSIGQLSTPIVKGLRKKLANLLQG